MNEEDKIVYQRLIYYNDEEHLAKRIIELQHCCKNLQSKIDKVIKLCKTEKKYIYDYAGRDEKTGKLLKGNKIELDVVNKSKILDILKEDK